MKTFRYEQMKYLYLFIIMFLMATSYSFIKNGFEIEILVSGIISFSFLILLLRSINITISDEYIKSSTLFLLKKREISYFDIKSIQLGEFERFYTKGSIHSIILLDKKGNVLSHLLYKAFREGDIREIILYIKLKNKKVLISEEVIDLFLEER